MRVGAESIFFMKSTAVLHKTSYVIYATRWHVFRLFLISGKPKEINILLFIYLIIQTRIYTLK
jgi:hypothetical protein